MLLSRVPAFRRVTFLLTSHLFRNTPAGLSHNLRYLSTTTPLRATESPKPLDHESLDSIKNSEMYQKISKSKEALLAIQRLQEVIQKLGVNTSSGTPPSMIQMSKLLMNSEFREASKNLIEEFKKVGIDMTDKAMIEKLQSMFTGGNSKS